MQYQQRDACCITKLEKGRTSRFAQQGSARLRARVVVSQLSLAPLCSNAMANRHLNVLLASFTLAFVALSSLCDAQSKSPWRQLDLANNCRNPTLFCPL